MERSGPDDRKVDGRSDGESESAVADSSCIWESLQVKDGVVFLETIGLLPRKRRTFATVQKGGETNVIARSWTRRDE